MKTPQSRSTVRLSLGIAALLSSPTLLHAATLPDPGDYLPKANGTRAANIYLQNHSGDSLYDSGDKRGGDVGFRLNMLAAKLMEYRTIYGMPGRIEVSLPYARQRVGANDSRESGLGNLVLGVTAWHDIDKARDRYWGSSLYLSLPTGQKKSRGLAVSEDRYALAVETGYLMPLKPRWSADLIGQIEVYTDDDSSDVSRRPLLSGVAHINYQFKPKDKLSGSLFQSYGGKETGGNGTGTGARNNTKLMFTWGHQYDKKLHLQLQYGQDIKVRSGLKLRSLQARAVYTF